VLETGYTGAAIASTTVVGPATINSTFSLIDTVASYLTSCFLLFVVLLEGKYAAEAPKIDRLNGELCYQLIS